MNEWLGKIEAQVNAIEDKVYDRRDLEKRFKALEQ
jgi:hypothetical protein